MIREDTSRTKMEDLRRRQLAAEELRRAADQTRARETQELAASEQLARSAAKYRGLKLDPAHDLSGNAR